MKGLTLRFVTLAGGYKSVVGKSPCLAWKDPPIADLKVTKDYIYVYYILIQKFN